MVPTLPIMSLRDDVVLRAIHQLIEALLRAAGLRRKKDLPAAEQALGDGLRSLGLPLELVARVDATTLAGLVTDPAHRVLLAAALRELALLRDAEGRLEEAINLRLRSEALEAGVELASLPEAVRAAVSQGASRSS